MHFANHVLQNVFAIDELLNRWRDKQGLTLSKMERSLGWGMKNIATFVPKDGPYGYGVLSPAKEYHSELVMDTSMIEQIMEVMLDADLIVRKP